MSGVVMDVLSERAKLSLIEMFTDALNGRLGASDTFSRILSKMTIVSWTE